MQLEITILNWEKYNTRKDVTNPTWFRLQNDIWISESVFGLTAEEKWVWICLLCHASKKQCGELSINSDWFVDKCGVTRQVFESAIEKLSRNVCVTSTLLPRTLQTDKQTNIQTLQHELDVTLLPTEISSDQVVMEFLTRSKIKTSSVLLWLKTYENTEWLKFEFLKMLGWLDANPHRKPKSNYTSFVRTWLTRAWEQHRKTLPSNKVLPKTEEVDIWKQS